MGVDKMVERRKKSGERPRWFYERDYAAGTYCQPCERLAQPPHSRSRCCCCARSSNIS
jgi:hypothetical protein